MSNVIDFSSKHHPAGGMAMHHEFGVVDVFAVDGMMRGIVYQHIEELSLDQEPEDVLYSENIEYREAWVHVNTLKEANLEKNIELAIQRGEIPRFLTK